MEGPTDLIRGNVGDLCFVSRPVKGADAKASRLAIWGEAQAFTTTGTTEGNQLTTVIMYALILIILITLVPNRHVSWQ